MTEVTEVAIVQTDAPSRSKQAGPCWIRLDLPDGDPLYAATTVRTVTLPVGTLLRARAKVTLRRVTRTSNEREAWDLTVTGDPTDVVTLRLGSPQAIEAEVRGVVAQ